MKKVLAIDGGPTQSAWLEYTPCTLEPPGQIMRFGISPNFDLEARIAHTLHSAEWRVVCEDVENMGGTVGADTFATAKQAGRFELLAQQAGLDFEFLARTSVKEFLLGARTGKDPDVRAALCRLFKIPFDARKSEMGPLKGIATHVWAALAVALAWDIRDVMRRRAAQ